MGDSTPNALEEARKQLSELLEAARKGAIIPIRLPGQVESILNLLEGVEVGQAAPPPPPDVAALKHENAEFMKTAIHELRTPMTSIRGYSDMLGNPSMVGEMSDMQKQLIDVIRANSRRMENLLVDMSYVNKLRGDILIMSPKIDTFKNLALMVEKRAAPMVKELNRALEFDIPQGLPILNIDGELLVVSLLKLIENGLRYSPEGSGKVTVRGSAEGSKLVLSVEDNGIGMTPEEVAKLGTMFWRSDNDAVRTHKGSGLGIPIAYGLLKALEAEILVTSAPGAGTTFLIKLPGMV